MLYYIARIELRGNPSGEDYTNLHAAMKKYGFLQQIAVGGHTWELPHAEYVWETATVKSASTVRDELKILVGGIYKDFLILISRTDEVAGYLVQAS